MGEDGRRVRVMLVEDNAAVRAAVAALLTAAGDVEICAEAASVAEARTAAESAEPDVVLVDLRLPDGTGVEAARDVRATNPGTHVLLLTSASEEAALVASLLAAASGYVIKQLLGEDLVGAVRAAAEGTTLIDPAVRAAALDRLQCRFAAPGPVDSRILVELAAGRTDEEIGLAVNLEEVVVRRRVASIACEVGAGARRARPGRLRARSRFPTR